MRSPLIYLASAFANRELVRGYADRLRARGYVITEPWFEKPVPPGSELALDAEQQRRIAELDYCGVINATIAWVMAPEAGGCGCWFEMGVAVAHGKHVIYSGPARTIFGTLAEQRFDTNEQAFDWLTKMWWPLP